MSAFNFKSWLSSIDLELDDKIILSEWLETNHIRTKVSLMGLNEVDINALDIGIRSDLRVAINWLKGKKYHT